MLAPPGNWPTLTDTHLLPPMCAKKYSPQPKRPASPAPSVPAPSAEPVAAQQPAAVPQSGGTVAIEPSWMDSADPKRRKIARIVLAVVWVYVGALWLLALDQWFNWGVLSTKIPPLP